jgi:hypothetical protein
MARGLGHHDVADVDLLGRVVAVAQEMAVNGAGGGRHRGIRRDAIEQTRAAGAVLAQCSAALSSSELVELAAITVVSWGPKGAERRASRTEIAQEGSPMRSLSN